MATVEDIAGAGDGGLGVELGILEACLVRRVRSHGELISSSGFLLRAMVRVYSTINNAEAAITASCCSHATGRMKLHRSTKQGWWGR